MRSNAFSRGAPLAQRPGCSSRTVASSLQVKYREAVIGTIGVLSTGQRPGVSRVNNVTFRHEYAMASRTGTSGAPDVGHVPGFSSIADSSPGVGHAYTMGGNIDLSAGFRVAGAAARGATTRTL